MECIRLPDAGRFAEAVVGWNHKTSAFFVICYTERKGCVALRDGAISSIGALQEILHAFAIAVPVPVQLYLSATRTADAEELRRLRPQVSDLLLPSCPSV